MDGSARILKTVQQLTRALAPTQQELARELNVSYSTLYSWSVGRRQPDPQNALRLAELAAERARVLDRLAGRLRAAVSSRSGSAPHVCPEEGRPDGCNGGAGRRHTR